YCVNIPGRMMYVIPFCMGPLGSPLSKIGVQVTDSNYVLLCMRIMTRVCPKVWELLGDQDFVKCIHSMGCPRPVQRRVKNHWPCNPEKVIIAHFPEERKIKSFGSGYGGNSLLGKKCFALRIASVIARDEGWMAEHMLIMCITTPRKTEHFVAAAFPSACGKTNLAMLNPGLPGFKIQCIGKLFLSFKTFSYIILFFTLLYHQRGITPFFFKCRPIFLYCLIDALFSIGKTIMHDPMAMRPFMGYNFGHYLQHWLDLEQPGRKMPKIFHVNWFRLDEHGKFLWPGFGENIRVLDWILKRVEGDNTIAVSSPVGWIPKKGSIDMSGLGNINEDELFSLPSHYWLDDSRESKRFLEDQVGSDCPPIIMKLLDEQEAAFGKLQ
uniref:phosphoenolpyruvate carboxykinase (GTP) n=1 Tax=Biomphalaria glabrata TaxID=6526 RepID=A0A2C9K0Q4_BIOGL